MERFITIASMEAGEAVMLWEVEDGDNPSLISAHRSLDEIDGAAGHEHYRFAEQTTLSRQHLNASRYPVVDNEGRPLWSGARVRFCIQTHFINTVSGEGSFVAVDAYGGTRLVSDLALPVYGPNGTIHARRREVYTATHSFERESALGSQIRLSSQLGDPHEHGAQTTFISLDDDPRRVCTLEFRPVAIPAP